MNPSCCEIVKTAFTLIPSKLLKCMFEVHKLNIPFVFQEPNVYPCTGKDFVEEEKWLFTKAEYEYSPSIFVFIVLAF